MTFYVAAQVLAQSRYSSSLFVNLRIPGNTNSSNLQHFFVDYGSHSSDGRGSYPPTHSTVGNFGIYIVHIRRKAATNDIATPMHTLMSPKALRVVTS